MNKIKRDAPKYLEMEKFKDYELTNCIAYEMMIRSVNSIDYFNKNLEKSLSIYFEIDIKLKELAKMRISYLEDNNIEEDDDTIDYDWELILSETCFESPHNLNFFIEQFDEKFRDIIGKVFDLMQKIDNSLSTLQISYYKADVPAYITQAPLNQSSKSMISILRDKKIKMEDNITKCFSKNSNHIYDKVKKDGFSIDYELFIPKYKIKHINNNTNLVENARQVYKHTKVENSIRPQFSRPIIKKDYKIVNVELNIDLPMNELLAYVKYIKQEYEKDLKILMSSKEFLDLEDIDKPKKIKMDNLLTKQEKVANMFYLYDARKKNHTNLDIQYEIARYYKDRRSIDPRIIKKYFDIAFYYIDGGHYKELI